MAETTPQTGNIYDLGYRGYDGERLGRRYAIMSLYLYSLRAIFGLGRSAWAKVFAFGLAGIALLPAIAQLAIAALSPINFRLVRPENHFNYVEVILALFCALSAPEILGRDQRNQTLPLYFSRALARTDYVTAKAGALMTALFAVLVLPILLTWLGSAVADNDLVAYFRHNVDEIPPILASSLVVAFLMSSVALAIASMSSRRAISTIAILAYFVIFSTVSGVLVATLTGGIRSYAVFLSPIFVLDGTVHWIFSAAPEQGSDVAKVDLAGVYYLLAAIVYTGAGLALLYRRFMRMSV